MAEKLNGANLIKPIKIFSRYWIFVLRGLASFAMKSSRDCSIRQARPFLLGHFFGTQDSRQSCLNHVATSIYYHEIILATTVLKMTPDIV